MSLLTTTPMKSAPAAAAGVTIAAGITPTWGAWVELLAATAAPAAIAGIHLGGGSYSAQTWELDLGTGPNGAEVSVGMLRLYLHNSGSNITPSAFFLPVPIGGIGAGKRVVARARSLGTGSGPSTVALSYYENFDSDHVMTSTQVLAEDPAGAALNITPNATPWANSAWVTLIASAPSAINILALVHASAIGSEAGMEFDLGIGAAGAETVITTLRDTMSTTRFPYTYLPGPYPLAAGTRLAVRLRKAGTSTSGFAVGAIYYTNVSVVAAVETVRLFILGPL